MENQIKKLITALVGYAVLRDIPAEKLLRSSNITLKELADTGTMLSPKQVSNIWLNAQSMSKHHLFGLHFGESLQLQAIGIVGEIIKSSQTIGEALTIAAGLTHLITDLIKLEVTHDDSCFTIEFLPVNQEICEQAVTVQTLDLLMVFVIHELDGLLFKKLRPISVSYARPMDETEEYERIMRCVPRTGAPRNCIVFDIKYWDERIITSNYEHQKELLKLAGHSQEAGFSKKSIRERVSSYMLSNSYIKMVNLEDVASNFNTTPRTLQRKLKEESVSFQLLADEARKTLALTYLKDGSFQGKEISFMLGYNELSAFTRTFKRWTGLTPAAYRKKFLQTSEGSEISVH